MRIRGVERGRLEMVATGRARSRVIARQSNSASASLGGQVGRAPRSSALHSSRRPRPPGGRVGGRREHADASVGVVVPTKRKRARITLYCGRRVFTADDRELTGIARFPPEPRYSQPRCCTTKTSNRWSYHYLRLIIRWSRFGAAADPTKCARPPRPAEAGADVLS